MENLQEQINKLEELWNSLTNSTTIPKEVDSAFRTRLKDISQTISISSTSASAHNRAVNESGSGTYSVLSTPSGYLTVTIAGTARDIPYF